MGIEEEIKELIISSLELEDISASDINEDEALFKEGLGLDSIDALELGMALKKKYNLVLAEDKKKNAQIFYSVKTIADYIRANS